MKVALFVLLVCAGMGGLVALNTYAWFLLLRAAF